MTKTDKNRPIPGLLVSVKNGPEAIEAIRGGTDILDIKDPNSGPLGMADAETIQNILGICEQYQSIETSVALGELEEWSDSRQIPTYLNRLDYLKVGPSNSENLDEWFDKLVQLKTRFQNAGIHHPRWIAVLYADQKPGTILFQSQQPQLKELAITLKEYNFAGLLIDTAHKQKGSLRTHFSGDQLGTLTTVLQSQQLLCSFAGRLTFQDIETLIKQSILPNYYAIRSAVCTGGDRQSNVECQKVQELKCQLKQTAG